MPRRPASSARRSAPAPTRRRVVRRSSPDQPSEPRARVRRTLKEQDVRTSAPTRTRTRATAALAPTRRTRTQPEPTPRARRVEPATTALKSCACGCGEDVKSATSDFLRGHHTKLRAKVITDALSEKPRKVASAEKLAAKYGWQDYIAQARKDAKAGNGRRSTAPATTRQTRTAATPAKSRQTAAEPRMSGRRRSSRPMPIATPVAPTSRDEDVAPEPTRRRRSTKTAAKTAAKERETTGPVVELPQFDRDEDFHTLWPGEYATAVNTAAAVYSTLGVSSAAFAQDLDAAARMGWELRGQHEASLAESESDQDFEVDEDEEPSEGEEVLAEDEEFADDEEEDEEPE